MATTARFSPRRWTATRGQRRLQPGCRYQRRRYRQTRQDTLILDSDYGFHATPAPTLSTPPARPAFDLDVNSDTAPLGDAMTTDATVNFVGQTDPNVTVTLQQTGAVTKSNANGLFVFFNVPLTDGDNTFTTIATNAGGISSQFTKIFTRSMPGQSLTPPAIIAALGHDTGRSPLDNITSDDTIIGTITAANPIASFEAQVDQTPVGSVLGTLSGTTLHDHARTPGDA